MSTASEKMMNQLVDKANVGRQNMAPWKRGQKIFTGGVVTIKMHQRGVVGAGQVEFFLGSRMIRRNEPVVRLIMKAAEQHRRRKNDD